MSNHKKDAMNPDGNFANFMMAMVAAPVVMAWVGLSIFLEMSEGSKAKPLIHLKANAMLCNL